MQSSTTSPEDATPMLGADTPANIYIARHDVFAHQRDEYQRQRMLAANLTVLLFFAPAVFIVFAIGAQSMLLLIPAALVWVACGYFFVRQGRLDARYRRFKTLAEINDEGLRRLERDWPAMPLREPPEPPAPIPAFAGDLDLLGHASLQHLLNTANTPAAQQRLTGWLLAPAAPEEIRERQEAVAELAEIVDFRDELTLFGRLSGMSPVAYHRFLEWAEQEPWLSKRPTLIWISRILPVLTVGLGVLNLAGIVRLPLWLLALAASIIFTASSGKQIEELIDQVSDRQAVFQPYEGIFTQVAQQPFAAERLRRVQRDLAAEQLNADEQMRRLGRILQFGDLRLSMFFPIIQAFLLWNFHTLWLLEGWQQTAGRRVRVWLETLSELEALSALATLAADNPTWAFPEIIAKSADEPALSATRPGASAVAASGLCRQRCHHWAGGTLPLCHRLEHVGQEHAAARHRRECRAGAGGRAGLRGGDAADATDAGDQHPRAGLAGIRRLVLHGGATPSARGGGDCAYDGSDGRTRGALPAG